MARAARAASAAPVLTLRELNRATLARQMLLARQKASLSTAIESLLGVQAQVPRAMHVGLWSRLEGYRRQDLAGLAHQRQLVRASLMRATIHLVTARDYLALRGLMQPMLSGVARSAAWGRRQRIEPAEILGLARDYFANRSSRIEPFRKQLRDSGMDADRAWATTMHVATDLPLVRVPDGSVWAYSGSAEFTLAETWLGRDIPEDGDIRAIIPRYLANLGPASVADMQAWCGLRNLKAHFEALRPQLATFRDEDGKELFDVPDGLRPDPDAPAPARFMPDYDNAFLGLADRRRFIAREHWDMIKTANFVGVRPLMIDGRIAGSWWSERVKGLATLTIRTFDTAKGKARADLAEEGERLLRFVEEDADDFDVRFGEAWSSSGGPVTGSKA